MSIKTEYKVAYKVYETDRFDDFKFLEENRDISDNHVLRLATSIQEGYQMPPIIVNENMEVVDGQHRLQAFKTLSHPVQFIVQSDMKENTLQRANTDVVKWTTSQHVEYHVKQGNEDYIKLKEFKEYTGMPWVQTMRILGKSKDTKVTTVAKILQYGLFEVKHETDAYAFADEVILRMRMESPTGKVVSAIKNIYDAGADTKRMVTVINAVEEEVQLLNTVPKIMETIVKVYNKGLKRSETIKLKEWGNGQLRASI